MQYSDSFSREAFVWNVGSGRTRNFRIQGAFGHYHKIKNESSSSYEPEWQSEANALRKIVSRLVEFGKYKNC